MHRETRRTPLTESVYLKRPIREPALRRRPFSFILYVLGVMTELYSPFRHDIVFRQEHFLRLREIAADGKSRTVTASGTSASGKKVSYTAVYDKQ